VAKDKRAPGMRLTLAISLILAVLWSGYWVVGWIGLERGIDRWAQDRRTEGLQIERSDARVRGFPSRFDTTLSDPKLTDPRTGWAWEGPFFQLLALSYRPNHLIAVWPNTHTLFTPRDRYEIAHDQARASLVFAGTDLRVDRTTFVIDKLSLGAADWALEAGAVRFATRSSEATEFAHDIGLAIERLRPARGLKDRLDPTGELPETIGTLRLDAVLGFDAAWDRFALKNRKPRPTSLTLRTARATWGGLDLRITADLALDDFGLASGRITLKATNWRRILELLERGKITKPGLLPVIEGMLEAQAAYSDAPNTLDLPITVTRGRMSVGVIPFGQIAPLVIE